MNWSLLTQNRCPRCQAKLETHGMLSSDYTCTDSHCLFKITEKRYNEIIGSIRKREANSYDPDKNLAELNNLEL